MRLRDPLVVFDRLCKAHDLVCQTFPLVRVLGPPGRPEATREGVAEARWLAQLPSEIDCLGTPARAVVAALGLTAPRTGDADQQANTKPLILVAQEPERDVEQRNECGVIARATPLVATAIAYGGLRQKRSRADCSSDTCCLEEASPRLIQVASPSECVASAIRICASSRSSRSVPVRRTRSAIA